MRSGVLRFLLATLFAVWAVDAQTAIECAAGSDAAPMAMAMGDSGAAGGRQAPASPHQGESCRQHCAVHLVALSPLPPAGDISVAILREFPPAPIHRGTALTPAPHLRPFSTAPPALSAVSLLT